MIKKRHLNLFKCLIFFLFSVFLCACGYTREEKLYMENVEELGSQNAINYIKDKYGISAEIENIEICKDREIGRASCRERV